MTTERVIAYQLRQVDLLRARADVVALKYARRFNGAGRAVAEALAEAGESVEMFKVDVDDYALAPSGGFIGASRVLFIRTQTW